MISNRTSFSGAFRQTIIQNKSGWQIIDWKELWEYKDLFFFLVLRDIKVLYKQTILGFLWAIIRPVFSMVVFSVVFGGLAKVPSDGIPYPIFSYAALIPWTYFSTCVTKSTQSLISDENILTKVYVPRIIIPNISILSGLIDFAIAFSILALMMIWYRIVPSYHILLLPLLILLLMISASGIGMWLSALAIQYRDIKHAVPFLVQLLMYMAPVVWPVSLIPHKYRMVYALYPMAGVIEGFRSCLLGNNPIPWDLIGIGTISAFLTLISGALYFQRMERFFADLA